MTTDQMLARADHIFIGVVEKQELEHWLFLHVPGDTSGYWKVLRRRVRVENGRYHVVRDWWRSIFPIYSGKHDRLPLDDSHPFWERVGLLGWWIGEGHSNAEPWYHRHVGELSLWRTMKIARGLVRPARRWSSGTRGRMSAWSSSLQKIGRLSN